MQYDIHIRVQNSQNEGFERKFVVDTEMYDSEKYKTVDEVRDFITEVEHSINDPDQWDTMCETIPEKVVDVDDEWEEEDQIPPEFFRLANLSK